MTNLQKFDEELDKYTFTLKGELMNSKHPQLINVARNLKKRLVQLREPRLDDAINYDKAVEILVQEYLDFAEYLMINIYKSQMTRNFTLEEKVEHIETELYFTDPLQDVNSIPTKNTIKEPLEPILDVSTDDVLENMFKPKKNVKKATTKRKIKAKNKK